MGRNAEAYVDDIVVKAREGRTFIEELEETFANLRKVNQAQPSAPLVYHRANGWDSSCHIAG
jgi:hypothetical protein